MEEIEFSIFDQGPDAVDLVRNLLSDFESREKVHINLTVMPFSGSWARLVQVALYHDGPDVSMIGSTWVSDFVRMNALRPFTLQEIRTLGGAESFLPASWRSSTSEEAGIASIWAVPWLTDTRLLYYHRAPMEKAGLDPLTAFQSADALESTLQRLQACGVESPIVIPTLRSRIGMHHLACYIWGAGGDFLSPDGNEIVFDQPAARQGMKNYLHLGRYLSTAARGLGDGQTDNHFWSEAAITFSGQWLATDPRMGTGISDGGSLVGIASIPGVPFVGGFHLVTWQHTNKARTAIKLIDYLAGPYAGFRGHSTNFSPYPSMGLPARLELIDRFPPPGPDDPTAPIYQPPFSAILPLLKEGHALPAGHMWGLIEKHLTDLLPILWEEVLASENSDLDAILNKFIPPLVRRLKLSLSSIKG
jgi:multiple sugar transport system substrate-binding protein